MTRPASDRVRLPDTDRVRISAAIGAAQYAELVLRSDTFGQGDRQDIITAALMEFFAVHPLTEQEQAVADALGVTSKAA